MALQPWTAQPLEPLEPQAKLTTAYIHDSVIQQQQQKADKEAH